MRRHPSSSVGTVRIRCRAGMVVVTALIVCWSLSISAADEGQSTSDDETSEVRVVDLAVGGHHACAVSKSGAVYCWGRNSDGQVGSIDDEYHAKPRRVAGLDDARRVVAGAAHTCVLHDSGRVSCWGFGYGPADDKALRRVSGPSNFARVVQEMEGDGPYDSRRKIRRKRRCNGRRPLDGIVDLSAGAGQTCALHESGGVLCWGDDAMGHFGVDVQQTLRRRTATDVRTARCPVPVWGLQNVSAIESGPMTNCALHKRGEVTCWGETLDEPSARTPSNKGNLAAAGSSSNRSKVARSSGRMLRFPARSDHTDLAVGAWQACLFGGDEKSKCLGYNRNHFLIPDGPRKLPTPREVPWIDAPRDIAVGFNQVCVVTDRDSKTGRIRCAGLDDGPVRPESDADSNSYLVPDLEGAVQIGLGGWSDASRELEEKPDRGGESRGLTVGGEMYSLWPLGDFYAGYRIGGTGGFGCARLEDGGVACWGSNQYGQLGDGTRKSRSRAASVGLEKQKPRPAENSRRRGADDSNQTCEGSIEYGAPEASNTVTLRERSRSRTFHVPELRAQLREDGSLRIEFPTIEVGRWSRSVRRLRPRTGPSKVGGSNSKGWYTRRWEDFSFLIKPSEGPGRSLEDGVEVRAQPTADAEVPERLGCMFVPFRRRGDATIETWKPSAETDGPLSGRVTGEVTFRAGPPELGSMAVEFDIAGIRPPESRQFVRPRSRSSFMPGSGGDGRTRASEIRVLYEPGTSSPLSIDLRGPGGEPEQNLWAFNFGGRPGLYRADPAIIRIDSFGSSGAKGAAYRLDRSEPTPSFFAEPRRYTELPEAAEEVATFDVGRVTHVEELETRQFSRALETPHEIVRRKPKFQSTSFSEGLVGFHRKPTTPGAPAPGRLRFRLTKDDTSDDAKPMEIERIQDHMARGGGRELFGHPARVEFSVEDGRPYALETTVPITYELPDRLKEKFPAADGRRSGEGTYRAEVETRVRVTKTDEGLTFRAENPVQGEYSIEYPTRQRIWFRPHVPFMLRALPLEAGYGVAGWVPRVETDRASARIGAPGLDGDVQVRPGRVDIKLIRARIAVVTERPLKVEGKKREAYLVRVKYGRRTQRPRTRHYWVDRESGRLLKIERVYGDQKWRRVVD